MDDRGSGIRPSVCQTSKLGFFTLLGFLNESEETRPVVRMLKN